MNDKPNDPAEYFNTTIDGGIELTLRVGQRNRPVVVFRESSDAASAHAISPEKLVAFGRAAMALGQKLLAQDERPHRVPPLPGQPIRKGH